MDIKLLKKLAAECRKLGISHYKDPDGTEFTLTGDFTKTVARPKRKLTSTEMDDALDSIEMDIPGDFPSEEELLMWSAGSLPENEDVKQ